MENANKGVLYAGITYVLWGIYPIFWWFLRYISPFEILVNRIIWSFLTIATTIIIAHRWPSLVESIKELLTDKKKLLLLIITAFLLSSNWLVYTIAVTSGRLLEASLGYYIDPIISILLGTFVLKEKLKSTQIAATAIAGVGVIYMTINIGRPPLISLYLAFAFAIYGLCKKMLKLEPLTSLFCETFVALPFAMLLFGNTLLQGNSTFNLGLTPEFFLLIGTGVITISPLFFFGHAAALVPLKTLGIMRYITPTLKLFVGVLLFGESFTTTHLITFTLIWIACLLFANSEFGFLKNKLKKS